MFFRVLGYKTEREVEHKAFVDLGRGGRTDPYTWLPCWMTGAPNLVDLVDGITCQNLLGVKLGSSFPPPLETGS